MGEVCSHQKKNTPPKIHVEPENDGLEDDFPLKKGCILRFHVNLAGCKCWNQWDGILDRNLNHTIPEAKMDVSKNRGGPPKWMV